MRELNPKSHEKPEKPALYRHEKAVQLQSFQLGYFPARQLNHSSQLPHSSVITIFMSRCALVVLITMKRCYYNTFRSLFARGIYPFLICINPPDICP